jgi:hypothetical protein
MLFYVFPCLTVLQQHLLNRNTRDTGAEKLMEAPPRKKEDKIFEIIDRVLTQVFGEEATLLIYKHLERHYSLSQSEFSEKIDVFAKGLEDFLSSGAYVVESKILDDIYSSYSSLRRTELERTPEEYDFASQIKIAIQKGMNTLSFS